MVTGLLARRDPCDDMPYGSRQATLVDFRGSNLSDRGSIPRISTIRKDQQFAGWSFSINDKTREFHEKNADFGLSPPDHRLRLAHRGTACHPDATSFVP